MKDLFQEFRLDQPTNSDDMKPMNGYSNGVIFQGKEDWEDEIEREKFEETQRHLQQALREITDKWTAAIEDPNYLRHTEEEMKILEKSLEEAMARSCEYDAVFRNLKPTSKYFQPLQDDDTISLRTTLKRSYLQSRSDNK